MNSAGCAWIERDDVFEGYVRGALGPEEGDAFEVHLLECEGCYEKARTLVALHAELARVPAERAPEASAAMRRLWRWALVPLAAGVCVVAAAVWWARTPARTTSAPVVAQAPSVQAPASTPAAAGSPDVAPPSRPDAAAPAPAVVAMSALAHVDPPLYAPVALRGPRDEAAEQFQAAMRRYSAGDYAGALAGLRAADTLKPDAPRTRFFIAVCQLLIGQNAEAADGFERTIALGDSAYVEDARFYLAKTFVRLGRLAEARRELQRTIRLGGGLELEARDMLNQLDAFTSRTERPPGD
jgi:tetratricopeptide (TPR) repeat protein